MAADIFPLFESRLVRVAIADTAEFLFDAMQGTDGLSTLSEYRVRLLHRSMQVDVRRLLGKSLTLTIQTAAAPRHINGVIARFALVGQEGDADRYFVYEAVVVPWLWLATHKKEFRIYQNQSVPETIKQVLTPYGYAFAFDLVETYAPRVYCVQYDETDCQFVSRLLEAEGIHYYFRHDEDQHTLVMSDEVQSHQAVAGYEQVPYFTEDKLTLPQQDYMTHVAVYQDLRPGQYATDDYNFTTPKADLKARQQIKLEHEHNQAEVYEWPGNYGDNPLGERYARQRMQEQHHVRDIKTFISAARGVATGSLFSLVRCPRLEENREYLVVGTHYDLKENNYHSISADDAEPQGRKCLFTLTVQDAKLPYRPPRITDKPRTKGPQTAVVVGPEGKEIWTNEYGQVKVHFHWDRYDKRDENSSCWIRVSSSWASGNFGAIQVPRIGDEVIVDFLNGDPDYPIITGRVYNAAMMPPWKLPENETQMGIYSRSTPGGNYQTANVIRFEDKSGQEEVFIQAEKNTNIYTKNDLSRITKRNMSSTTHGFRHEIIKKSSLLEVEQSMTIRTGDRTSRTTEFNLPQLSETMNLLGHEIESTNVLDNRGGRGDFEVLASGSIEMNAKGSVGAAAGNNLRLSSAENTEIDSRGRVSIDAAKLVEISSTQLVAVRSAKAIRLTTGHGYIEIDSSGKISISGSEISIDAAGQITINGNRISLN